MNTAINNNLNCPGHKVAAFISML